MICLNDLRDLKVSDICIVRSKMVLVLYEIYIILSNSNCCHCIVNSLHVEATAMMYLVCFYVLKKS